MSATETVLRQLQRYESRNVTCLLPEGGGPIVWERARGVHVWDAEGRRYLDLTAAFGVAAAGHANPQVVRAGQRQMARLLHAMGDVHPHALKAELARELSRITFERWTGGNAEAQSPKSKVQRLRSDGRAQGSDFVVGAEVTRLKSPQKTASPSPKNEPRYLGSYKFKTPSKGQMPKSEGEGNRGKTIFGNSGFEAVEAALKTALLATGRRGVVAFEGAYHGLGYGALNATHREFFRSPFRLQLAEFGQFVPFPTSVDHLERCAAALARLFRREQIGAVLVEPVQGRSGIRIPPPAFLPLLRQFCDEQGALLIVDEIYTGFGRTGCWFACEHAAVVPDIICLGKALTGGFPLSACVGRAELMDAAWPVSTGEAIHTSTFLGHPVGCAMALAQIAELRRRQLVERSARLGRPLLAALANIQPAWLRAEARGLGLMAGLELRHADGAPATAPVLRIIQAMLQRGFILLPEGEHSNVLSFTPPLTIGKQALEHAVNQLATVLAEVARP